MTLVMSLVLQYQHVHPPAALPSFMLWPKPSRSEGMTCTAWDSSKSDSSPAGRGSNSGQLGPVYNNTAGSSYRLAPKACRRRHTLYHET